MSQSHQQETRRPSPSKPELDGDELFQVGRIMGAFGKLESEIRGWREATSRHVEVWTSVITQERRAREKLQADVDELLELERQNARGIKLASRAAPAVLGLVELVRFLWAFIDGPR